jgi:hypothetical protein
VSWTGTQSFTGTNPVCVANPTGNFTATYSTTIVAPTLASVSPATGSLGQTLTVTLTGTNLVAKTIVSFGPNITVNSTTVNSTNTQLTANITISTSATIGQRNVSVTNTGGGTATLTNGFTVTPGAAAKLAFGQQPTTTGAGAPITPAVTVQVEDSGGNVVTASTASITIAIGTNPGAGTLSGPVTANAVNGVATFSNLSINNLGTGYTLSATSGTLTGATSTAFNITAGAATTLSVAGFPGSINVGTAGNFTVTVKDSHGNTATGYTGTVHFTSSDSAATLPANYAFIPGDNGTHTFSATLNTAGAQSITASDTGTSTITGTQTGIQVNSPTTTTTVSSSLNPSTFGQAVTFTATVSSGSGTPTGTVNFYDGASCGAGTLVASAVPLTSGGATFTTSTLSVGTHTLFGCYTPTLAFAPSSGSVSQQVGVATPVVTGSGPGTSTYGTNVTLSVTVSAPQGAATPTGTVQFQFTNSGTTYNICSDGSLQPQPAGTPCAITLSNGTASVTTSKLPAGMTADAITATYYPTDGNYTGGSTTINYTVGMATTQTTVAITPATSATYGDKVTLASTVGDSTQGSTGIPTGTVQFQYSTDSGTNWVNIGEPVTLDTSGNAQTTTTTLPAGTLGIKAVYSGDSDFSASNSGSTAYAVAQKSLTVSGITASNKPYDGTVTATLDASKATLVGVIPSDDVLLGTSGAIAAFGDANVGTGKTVTITGLSLTGTAASNYILKQPITTTANITAVSVTVTAPTPTVTYGDPVPTPLTPTYNAFVNGEDSGVLTTQPICTTTYTPGSAARSSQTTSCSGAVAANYTFIYANGAVTVNPALLTITANPQTKVYGAADPTLTYSAAGFKLTDSAASVLTGALTRATGETVAGSPYAITQGTLAANSNYTISFTGSTLTINPAPTAMGLASAVTQSSGAVTVSVTANVTNIAMTVPPVGTVVFTDNYGTIDPTKSTLSCGSSGLILSCQLTFSALNPGTHLISAKFMGANFVPSSAQSPNTTLAATITGPSSNNDVFAVNTAVNTTPVKLSASFGAPTSTDPSAAATTNNPSAIWTLTNTATNANLTPVTGTISAPNITGLATFTAADVYAFTLTFSDGLGGIVIANTVGGSPTTIVIYDPSAGFVTGGGWITSKPGAYTADPSLTGKATFGFVSKYQKGATVPTGDTEFQFQVANFEFHSNTYQWMVVSGSLAQYKGTGTINGSGNYNFMLTGLDGGLANPITADGFRMKITDPTTGRVIYDNKLSSDDSMQVNNTEALGDNGVGGGSIIIHTGK